MFSIRKTPISALWCVSSHAEDPIGHCSMCLSLKGHPRGHFIMFSDRYGHTIGHCHIFSYSGTLEGISSFFFHLKGCHQGSSSCFLTGSFTLEGISSSCTQGKPIRYCISLSPLRCHPIGHFNMFPHMQRGLQGIVRDIIQFQYLNLFCHTGEKTSTDSLPVEITNNFADTCRGFLVQSLENFTMLYIFLCLSI